MELERIAPNKIKYSISFEELMEKGFLKEDMLQESFIWDVLFDEMLEQASKEYELDTFGTVSIEIFSLTSKELVLILTLEEEESYPCTEDNSPIFNNQYIDDICYYLFEFEELEHVISFALRLKPMSLPYGNSSLYVWKNKYFLKIDVFFPERESLRCILGEYGHISSITSAYLDDYGKRILKNNAISTFQRYF